MSYEEERNNQHPDATTLETHWFNLGADWANARAQADITEARIRGQVQTKLIRAQFNEAIDALARVMNSDLVTMTPFNDYSEAFDNARELLKRMKEEK